MPLRLKSLPVAWVLVDALLIPGLTRAANDKLAETPD